MTMQALTSSCLSTCSTTRKMPRQLLREAVRVARRGLLIKDHTLTGFLAGPTLRLMDRVGNQRHGVALPYNYWTQQQWLRNFEGSA